MNSTDPLMTPAPLIHSRIAACLREIGTVGKTHQNRQQGYAFRSIDDFYDTCQPVLARNGVFITPQILSHTREERTTKLGGVLMTTLTHVRFRFYAEDGSYIEADQLGEGSDSGDKSANKAASQAMKYVLQQVFSIRVNGERLDTEHDSPEYMPRNRATTPPAAPKTPDVSKLRARMLQRLSELFGQEAVEAYAKSEFGCSANVWPEQHVPTSKLEMDALANAVDLFVQEQKGLTPAPKVDKSKLRAQMLQRFTERFGQEAVESYAQASFGCSANEWPDECVADTEFRMNFYEQLVDVFLHTPPFEPTLTTIVDKTSKSTNTVGPKEPDPNGTTTAPAWFWSVVIPVPRAGTTRADYLKHPDTIKSLYDAMKAGDAKARTRLWGIAREWQPEARVVDGNMIEPSSEELCCREALNAFETWHKTKGTQKPLMEI